MSNRIQTTILLTLSATVLGLGAVLARPSVQEKPAAAASGTYEIDTVHSAVVFRVMHLDTSWAFGRFNDFSGKVVYDEASPEKCSVEITIQIESVDTADKKRDDHLRSPDFYDATQFPTATFKSKTVKKAGDKKYTVTGDLEFHGVTKPVTLDLERVGASSGRMGARVGFYGTFTLKRTDFGMKEMPGALGDDVHVIVSLETVKEAEKR